LRISEKATTKNHEIVLKRGEKEERKNSKTERKGKDNKICFKNEWHKDTGNRYENIENIEKVWG
jgi:hypothetical protein